MMGDEPLGVCLDKICNCSTFNLQNFQTTTLLPMMPFEHYLDCKSYSILILNNTKRKVVLRKLLSHAGFDFNMLLVCLVKILLLGSKGKAMGWET